MRGDVFSWRTFKTKLNAFLHPWSAKKDVNEPTRDYKLSTHREPEATNDQLNPIYLHRQHQSQSLDEFSDAFVHVSFHIWVGGIEIAMAIDSVQIHI